MPLLAGPALAQYTVYRANRHIKVDDLTMEQMKTARGSSVCSFGAFTSASSAEKHALQFGGNGAACGCGE